MTMMVTMMMTMMHLSGKFFKNYHYYRMQVPAMQLSARQLSAMQLSAMQHF
jgi:uncharacterized protein (DUF486 family)